MATIDQDLAAIRTAVYGKDVREAIADGIDNCYKTIRTLPYSSTDSRPNANVITAAVTPITTSQIDSLFG